MESYILPSANTDFIAYDQGISSPKFVRLTTRNIPETKELSSSIFLPISMIIQPFAQQKPGENPIPLVDYGEMGPPRCRRCRAYINPFMSFIQGGSKFVCNMCLFPSDVGAEWFSPLNGLGKRQDLDHRPELRYGTVEFTVPKEYETCPVEPIKMIFAIDMPLFLCVRDCLLMHMNQETVLKSIPAMFNNLRVPEPALGALVQSSLTAMGMTGGKLIVFLSALPTWGPGSLRFREDSKLYNTDNEKQLFTAQNVYWNNIAKKCLTAGIGVDLFLFPTLYMDISTI
ncbi:hypothetical protein PCK2_000602, partial [Pneumocystis canis]